jgi:glutamate-5-semialdehyde dehydrogenase
MIAAIQQGLAEVGLPADSILYIDDPERALVGELLRLDAYVDMIIPRGGAGLHRFCRENATIPVITGGIGICHLFVDASADLDRAVEIIHNAKTQRPSVCNSLDTALVHREVAAYILPRIVERLGPDGVCFKADDDSLHLLGKRAEVEPAGPEDWDTEWLSLVLGLKVVNGLDEAIQHIQDHSTGHSDGILTTTTDHADHFVDRVDSAVGYVNASTRFTDGSQLGLGAEVAVSTQKLHARGPMALQELTSYKWIVIGEGQIRE